MAVSYKMLK